jgi:1-aminocyclopropane-1-carboxylate deaminase
MEQLFDTEKSIIQELSSDLLSKHNVRLYVKRDDLIDENVSGNKWRKLKFNVLQALDKKCDTILTFGGAFSNHLVATAAACKKAGLKSIGIVRGDELDENSNNTLKKCSEFGMQLKFVSRNEYQLKTDDLYLKDLHLEYPSTYIVPEGGSNFYGMIGCQEIIKEIKENFEQVFVAQGTSATSCGILLALPENTVLNVVPVLKNYDSVAEMRKLLNYSLFDEEVTEELLEKVCVHSEAHFGGYGKFNEELIYFIKQVKQEYNLPLDYVYTGKVFFEIIKLIQSGGLDNQTLLFVHTGGLQGNQSENKF